MKVDVYQFDKCHNRLVGGCMTYDLVIIGGGPGGYVAAIRAAQLKAKVAIIEKDNMGGVCLNWGCIPTKALLESAELVEKIRHSSDMGIDVEAFSTNITQMVQRSRNIVQQLTKGVQHLMDKHKVDVYKGHGRIKQLGPKEHIISIDNKTEIKAQHVIIATGASNRVPNGIIVDNKNIIDCRDAMTIDSIPKSLLIIGGGAIGLEFASFFRAIGSEVTIIEYNSRILAYADEDVSKFLSNALKKSGIKIINDVGVVEIQVGDKEIIATLSNGETLKASKCLVATGIKANTAELGLENTQNILRDKAGHIITGPGNATGEARIYAIGDVISQGPWLAHKAMQEGIRCVEQLFSDSNVPDVDPLKVPICVYSMPQVAQVGMTEAEAQKAGIEFSVGTFPLLANGKALTEKNNGFIKVIIEKNTGIFVGAHMVGGHVTELIHGYTLLQHLEGIAEDVHRTIFPHPTLSEALQEAILAAQNHALHI